MFTVKDALKALKQFEVTWLGQSDIQPRKVFITHGEALAADAMRKHIEERMKWNAEVPELFSSVEL